jgi:hypothetical protein
MKLESPDFTMDDVTGFMTAYRDRERNLLADRLQRVSDRVAELGPKIKAQSGEDGGWSAHETLAHIAVVSKFYGVLVHRISSGQLSELNLLEAVNLRDGAGQQMSQLETAELVRMTLADHARTIRSLREADPESMRKVARVDNGTELTAEEVARLPLVTHLEMHVEQLEKALGR